MSVRITRRRRTVRAATVAATVAVTVAATALAMAPPALAEPNPPGCPKGYFCAYPAGNAPWTGTPVMRTWGNWSGRVVTGSVFNNGRPLPGFDHVQLDYERFGTTWSECVHYNPGPGFYKIDFSGAYAEITSVTWRGEC